MSRVASGLRAMDWMARGACRQADPALFFPMSVTGTGMRKARAAKTVCHGCAVRSSCLSYALETMPDGIWGGTTLQERLAVRRLAARRARRAARQGGRA
ncbi:MAG: WhiB family transcriptional regulator [Streptosporangiaceae bacterium]|jgi:WhiB family transcriptional regulator, redox-sensing transcriptional regulator